jgi:hypothetical protein
MTPEEAWKLVRDMARRAGMSEEFANEIIRKPVALDRIHAEQERVVLRFRAHRAYEHLDAVEALDGLPPCPRFWG